MKRTPLTELEKGIVSKLACASFPPGTASKRFARNLADGYVKDLSDKGRKFFAYVVNRYRKQYRLTPDEQAYVNEWLSKELDAVPLRMEPDGPKESTLPLPSEGKDEQLPSEVHSGWLFSDNESKLS